MNKYYLQSSLKEESTAYIMFFFAFGSHFAYLGKWGLQLLFWITLYGFGIWGLIELFIIGKRVRKHNSYIYQQIEKIDKQEQATHLATLKAIAK